MTEFTNAKVGDKVLHYYCRSMGTSYVPKTIDKVGRIHLTVGGGKFRLDGREAGGGGYRIIPFCQELMDRQEARKKLAAACCRLINTGWRELPPALIYAVCDLMDSHTPKNTEVPA